MFFRGAGKAMLAGAAMAGSTLATAAAPEPQRRILHIQMGNEHWLPTPEEMANIVNEFQAADKDPLGAIIGTRDGVRATWI